MRAFPRLLSQAPACIVAASTLAGLLIPEIAIARPIPAASGSSLGGLVIPVEPRDGDINLRTLRAWHWSVGSTQRLFVQGDTRIDIAGWTFEGSRMVLWLERIETADGLVTQIAVWIPEATAHSASGGRGSSGRNLLVVGTVQGETVLDAALVTPTRPKHLEHVIRRADDRLAAWVADLQRTPPPLVNHPIVVGREKPPPDFVPTPGGSLPAAWASPQTPSTLEQRWLRQPGAMVAFSADHLTVDAGEDESTILADGNVVVHYKPATRSDALGALRLSAERAVIHASPASIAEGVTSLSADDVRGIYLEGAVIAESDREDYILRAQRMYYDFSTDRAVMLDAVLRTYDRERRVPVYARADELRQLAEDQWSGRNVQLSASSFATPTLSIGSSQATIRQIPGEVQPDGTTTQTRIEVSGRHNTIRAGGLPIFYWPWFKGYADRIPLRGQSTSFEKYRGVGLEFRWDLPALLGWDPMSEDDIILETSGYTKRGPALGLDWTWNRPGEIGQLDMWGIHDDTNKEERLSTGLTQQVPKTWRGMLLFEDRLSLGNDWNLQTQASWISDSTFINSWREDLFKNRREFETSAYLSRDSGDTSLSVLLDYSLNDFISNSWLLASQGFMLDEFPRASYRRFGKDLFELMTYSGDITFSRFKPIIPSGTVGDNGINVNAFRGPGPNHTFNANQPISDAFSNINPDWHTRVSSMHHLTMPLSVGPVQITPFASAQLQGWLENPSNTTDDESSILGLGGIGVHATTTIQRVFNDVHNDTLGIHRLRVLLDPWIKAWISGANFNPMDEADNPVYQPLVDATSRGGAVEVGLRHRLQTQRGGAGRWYEADLLTTSLAATFSTTDATRRWYTPRWYESNPLWSSFGNFVNGSWDFRPAEAITLTGEGVWDLDLKGFTRAAVAMNIDHSPRFRTGIAYRFFQVPEDYANAFPNQVKNAKGELLSFPISYEISKTYHITVSPQYNFSEDDFQSVGANLMRRLPDFDLLFYVRYDQIRDETIGGVSLSNTKF